LVNQNAAVLVAMAWLLLHNAHHAIEALAKLFTRFEEWNVFFGNSD
jgi:hypothetical protein